MAGVAWARGLGARRGVAVASSMIRVIQLYGGSSLDRCVRGKGREGMQRSPALSWLLCRCRVRIVLFPPVLKTRSDGQEARFVFVFSFGAGLIVLSWNVH